MLLGRLLGRQGKASITPLGVPWGQQAIQEGTVTLYPKSRAVGVGQGRHPLSLDTTRGRRVPAWIWGKAGVIWEETASVCPPRIAVTAGPLLGGNQVQLDPASLKRPRR
jgi:hypothetical protein